MCYGLYLGSGSRRPDSPGDEPAEDDATWVIKYGVAWALAGTLPQIVVGPWLMLSLPDGVRAELISGQSLGSLAFFVGLTVGLFSLVFLNAALMIPHVRGMAVGRYCERTGHRVPDGRSPGRGSPILVSEALCRDATEP